MKQTVLELESYKPRDIASLPTGHDPMKLMALVLIKRKTTNDNIKKNKPDNLFGRKNFF